MRATDVVVALGDRRVVGEHRTTIEITKDHYLGPRGDCIIGILADKGCRDLDENLRELVKRDNSRVEVVLKVGGSQIRIRGRGSSRLTLSDPSCIIIRKSDFTSPRTLMIMADRAASDIPRATIRLLHSKEARLELRIIAEA